MYKIKLNFFNPAKIADSGQAFRIHTIDDTHTELVAHGRYLQIASLGNNEYAFSCSEEEFKNIWHDYFDLSRDYESIIKAAPENDTFLNSAIQFGYGIRILKQEIFESLSVVLSRLSQPVLIVFQNSLEQELIFLFWIRLSCSH